MIVLWPAELRALRSLVCLQELRCLLLVSAAAETAPDWEELVKAIFLLRRLKCVCL